MEGAKPKQQKCKPYPADYFYIDMTSVGTAASKRHLFVAIDCTSQSAYAERYQEANTMVAVQCLRQLIAAMPNTIHMVLTDNGIQFTNRQRDTHRLCIHFRRRLP
jgi:membrane-anchored protein YejM (alkaline phosphatase superfamily)